jgi:hypothetical protein
MKIVSEASAHHEMTRQHSIRKDHMQICKMASRDDVEYAVLRSFLEERLGVTTQVASQS